MNIIWQICVILLVFYFESTIAIRLATLDNLNEINLSAPAAIHHHRRPRESKFDDIYNGVKSPSQVAAPFETYSIVDWRDKATDYNSRIRILILDDTRTNTLDEALISLASQSLSTHYIVDRNGTIYYLVDEMRRAWHAGSSGWGDRTNLNDISIGIKIVNSGIEKFTNDQLRSTAALCHQIINRYSITANNIVSHGDIAPNREFDVSGYFDWKTFYYILNIFPNLFDSELAPDEQRIILLQPADTFNNDVLMLERRLHTYGYPFDETKIDGIYDEYTQLVVAAFNRHFCPEIFHKEIDKNKDAIINSNNDIWYGISEERLNYLLSQYR